jgi:hypothetical protein
MHTPSELLSTYQYMTDGQLLQVANEGGLVPEAELVLAEELHRRNLKKSDLPQHKQSPRERLENESHERWSPLVRYHSLGFGFYGRKYLNESDRQENIQVRTKFFVFTIPMIPIASYRFKCTGDPNKWIQWNTQYRVLNRVPLNWDQVFLTWAKTVAWIIGAFAAAALYIWFTVEHQ